MNDTEHQRFFDVTMPKWYRKTALAVRVVGSAIALPCAWLMAHDSPDSSMWSVVGMIAGFLLLLIPSLPKAYIEQQNRIRGLRDGDFQQYFDKQEEDRSQPNGGE